MNAAHGTRSGDRRLSQARAVWDAKPALRAIYDDYYRRIARALRAGRTLELGAGSGNLKSRRPDVVASDVLSAPWLDLVADAMALPFADGSFDNIVMIDVLHHVPRPRLFFVEAARVLRPGGRIVMVEPAITPLSWPFYRFLHQERTDFRPDPLGDAPLSRTENPFDGNQAIPSKLVLGGGTALERVVPKLRLVAADRFSFLAYPLSGGFKSWQAIPTALIAPLLRVEDRLAPLLGRLAAFRLRIVIERRR